MLGFLACGTKFHNSWKALVHSPPGDFLLGLRTSCSGNSYLDGGCRQPELRESLAATHSHVTPAAADSGLLAVLELCYWSLNLLNLSLTSTKQLLLRW